MKSFFQDAYKKIRGTGSMAITQYKVYNDNLIPHHKIADGLFLGMIPIKEAGFPFNLFTDKFENQHQQIVKLISDSNPNRPST